MQVGFGTFAKVPFEQRVIVGYYYGFQECADLSRGQNTNKNVVDRDNVEYSMRILPPPSCSMHYINNGM